MKSSAGAMAVIALLLLVGCGVKERGPGVTPPAPVSTGNLPAGIVLTANKKFLVHPSNGDLKVGKMTVVYNVTTTALEPLGTLDYSYDVKYLMPDMPTMPVTPAEIRVLGAGQVSVTYDINMGGLWKFDVNVLKAGAVVDTLSYSFNVPDRT